MAAIESSTGNVHDLKEVKDVLYSISERLKYYFKALSLEDNFDASMYLSLQQDKENVSSLQITEEGLSSDYVDLEQEISSRMALLESRIELSVSKGDVTNQLNLEPDALTISGSRLIISGYYLNLDSDNNLTVRGSITAKTGSIAGWSIASGKMVGGDSSKITCSTFNNSNDIYLNRIVVQDTPGKTDLSYCEVAGGGATFLVDENTEFLDEFTIGSVETEDDLLCGLLDVHGSINCNSQIVAKRCYTKKNGSTWSDRRLKKDMERVTAEDAESFVKSLRPVTFRWKDTGEKSAGFIAQEVLDAEAAAGTDHGLMGTAGELFTLNYTGIMVMLLRKLQEQTREIDGLTA